MARPRKILTRLDIERAMRATLSNRAAARYLHVSYPHYKVYAKLYKDEDGVTLFEKHLNQGGKKIPKFAASTTPSPKGKRKSPSIADILEGRVSAAHYNPKQLKYKLISMGLLEPRCNHCGYERTRLLDGRAPLILQHKDRNPNNWSLDNLEFVCYNCAFLEGPNSMITEDMVERAEEGVDKVGPKIESTFELDDYQKEVLNSIFKDEAYKPGEEFISRF